jgi:hypothetical protein
MVIMKMVDMKERELLLEIFNEYIGVASKLEKEVLTVKELKGIIIRQIDNIIKNLNAIDAKSIVEYYELYYTVQEIGEWY